MKTSLEWHAYFKSNLKKERIDWTLRPAITETELSKLLKSIQAWQLGETSDGSNLLKATRAYAANTRDPCYVSAMELFIKEEQKHGNNLGHYLDIIGKPRIRKNWGDSLFRKMRHIKASMEMWTLAVIIVESAAQVFYQSLKDATNCTLLKQVCTDILIDEAAHIQFQSERMERIFSTKAGSWKRIAFYCYGIFYFATALVVWLPHRNVFRAGGNSFFDYFRKMHFKYTKTLGRLPCPQPAQDHAIGLRYPNKSSC